jgi:hypothetical protein
MIAYYKINVSEVSSVSIIMVDVMNGHASLMYVPLCQIDASFYVVLCSRRAESNCAVIHPTLAYHPVALPGIPVVSHLIFFVGFFSLCLSSWDFPDLCALECLHNLVLRFCSFAEFEPFLSIGMSGCNFISIASLTSRSM